MWCLSDPTSSIQTVFLPSFLPDAVSRMFSLVHVWNDAYILIPDAATRAESPYSVSPQLSQIGVLPLPGALVSKHLDSSRHGPPDAAHPARRQIWDRSSSFPK